MKLLDVSLHHFPVIVEERIVRVAEAIEHAPTLLEGQPEPRPLRVSIRFDAAMDAVAVHERDLRGSGLPAMRLIRLGNLRVHLPEEVMYALVETCEIERLDVVRGGKDVG